MLVEIRGRLFVLPDLVGRTAYWLALVAFGSLLGFCTDAGTLPLVHLILPAMLFVVLRALLISSLAVSLVYELEEWRRNLRDEYAKR